MPVTILRKGFLSKESNPLKKTKKYTRVPTKISTKKSV